MTGKRYRREQDKGRAATATDDQRQIEVQLFNRGAARASHDQGGRAKGFSDSLGSRDISWCFLEQMGEGTFIRLL